VKARLGDRKRLGLQLGLLAGIGIAFAIGSRADEARAGGDDCPLEGECTFKKPNIMIIMDYSTSMNAPSDIDNSLSRWQVAVAAIQEVVQPNSFLSQNTHLALMRFGHDPSIDPGSVIDGDASGLVDGHAIDVSWDDDNLNYHECNGQALVDSLDATVAPMMGAELGIGTWTKGALDAVLSEIDTTKADHPTDQQDLARQYLNILVTHGGWTNQDGAQTFAPAGDNPAIPAATMFEQQGIPTFVIAVAAAPAAELAADELAAAGGTTGAFSGDSLELVMQAMQETVQGIIDSIIFPNLCVDGLPRVMVLLDASSAMLNIDGGSVAGGMGETAWDQARDAIAGQASLFYIDVGVASVEELTYVGLAVFGHNEPGLGEQKILVDYGPCTKDNFAWALDPVTSCEMPGCDDPWAGPPITWTFKDSELEDPPAYLPTLSHMPQCGGDVAFCAGSAGYTHLGLQLIASNQQTHHANAQMDEMQPTTDATLYLNILITAGRYDGYSTDAQVQAELQQMYDAGIITHVIGFGEGADSPEAVTQLGNMASWGSGGSETYFDANNQAGLEAALALIFSALAYDPCCYNDCSAPPWPPNEPDPVPGDGDGDGDGDPGDGDGDATTGDGDADATTGDGDADATTSDGDADATTGGDTIGDDDTDSDATETGGPSIVGDEGCNCSTPDTDADRTRGLLGTILAFGLAGLVRPRRRTS
jgi:MYXO-CTERM domain-containing protein